MKSSTVDTTAIKQAKTAEQEVKKPEIILGWRETRPGVNAMIEKFSDDVYKVFQEQGVPLDAIVIDRIGESRYGNSVSRNLDNKVFFITNLRTIADLARNPEQLEGLAIHEAAHVISNDSLIHKAIKPVFEAQEVLEGLVEFHKSDPKAFYDYLKSDDEWYRQFPVDISDAAEILKPASDFMRKNGLAKLSDEELHVKFKAEPELRIKMAKVMALVGIKIIENEHLFKSLEYIYDSMQCKFDMRDEKHEALIGKIINLLEPDFKNIGNYYTIKRAAEYRADEETLNGKNPSSFINRLKSSGEYYAGRDIEEGPPITHPLNKDRISRLERLLAERDKKDARGRK